MYGVADVGVYSYTYEHCRSKVFLFHIQGQKLLYNLHMAIE
jgi:hypothetical protein